MTDADHSEIGRAVVKAVKADYVKQTITIQLEANLPDFAAADRDALAKWAEVGQVLRVEFSKRTRPAPLLDVQLQYGDGA